MVCQIETVSRRRDRTITHPRSETGEIPDDALDDEMNRSDMGAGE
jgi:hypothetical protein